MRSIIYILIAFFCCHCYVYSSVQSKNVKKKEKKIILVNDKAQFPRTLKDFTGRVLSDVASDLAGIFTFDTLKIACGIVPAYSIARPFDHKIHKHFYDRQIHKNIHQPPKLFADMVIDSAAFIIPIVTIRDLFSSDPYHQRRGEVFFSGLMLTWVTKNILKYAHIEGNKRPWHECFSKKERSYGGSPSGHCALFGFITSFWFKEKGPIVGVPLTIVTSLAMAMSIVTNRHYLSQVILGAGYGVMFGLAAHKTLEKSIITKDTKIKLVADTSKGVGIRLSHAF